MLCAEDALAVVVLPTAPFVVLVQAVAEWSPTAVPLAENVGCVTVWDKLGVLNAGCVMVNDGVADAVAMLD